MKSLLLSFFVILASMLPVQAQYTGKMVQKDSCEYMLQVVLKDSSLCYQRLPYRVFKFEQADINGDGCDDFVVGVIKKTILDSALRKRINIWRIENKNIVPLWLGSKMSHTLVDFEVKRIGSESRIFTVELDCHDLFLVAEYKWHSFGLKFIRYLSREISFEQAKLLMNLPNEKD